MDAHEPRVRRRGFFLHTETGEPDTAEHENAEGFMVRSRIGRSHTPRHFSSMRRAATESSIDDGRPQIRSGSVTGSRQREHSRR